MGRTYRGNKAARGKLGKTVVPPVTVVTPPSEERRALVDRLGEIDTELAAAKRSLKTYWSARHKIQQKIVATFECRTITNPFGFDEKLVVKYSQDMVGDRVHLFAELDELSQEWNPINQRKHYLEADKSDMEKRIKVLDRTENRERDWKDHLSKIYLRFVKNSFNVVNLAAAPFAGRWDELERADPLLWRDLRDERGEWIRVLVTESFEEVNKFEASLCRGFERAVEVLDGPPVTDPKEKPATGANHGGPIEG